MTPTELRAHLAAEGFTEQPDTGLVATDPRIGHYSRMTWWNRGDAGHLGGGCELVLLVEDEWTRDGAGDRVPTSAFLAREIDPREIARPA